MYLDASEHHDDRDARLIDMSKRLYPRLGPMYGVAGIILIAAVPFVGWWVVLPVFADALKSAVAFKLASRGRHVRTIFLADFYSSLVVIGTAIFFAGGSSSPFFAFFGIFAALYPLLFGGKSAWKGYAFIVSTTLLAALGPPIEIEHFGLFATGTMLCTIYAVWLFGTEITSSDVEYRSASLLDGLTGLANRRAFESDMEAIGGQVEAHEERTALIVGDIDFFKAVNDEHGHLIGDQVLIEIADELRSAFRASDTAYRLGGEEFALVARSVSEELAVSMADSLRARIAVSYPAGVEISMSFGVALRAPGESTEQWFERCDDALFAAKRAGRNRVEKALGRQG